MATRARGRPAGSPRGPSMWSVECYDHRHWANRRSTAGCGTEGPAATAGTARARPQAAVRAARPNVSLGPAQGMPPPTAGPGAHVSTERQSCRPERSNCQLRDWGSGDRRGDGPGAGHRRPLAWPTRRQPWASTGMPRVPARVPHVPRTTGVAAAESTRAPGRWRPSRDWPGDGTGAGPQAVARAVPLRRSGRWAAGDRSGHKRLGVP